MIMIAIIFIERRTDIIFSAFKKMIVIIKFNIRGKLLFVHLSEKLIKHKKRKKKSLFIKNTEY